MSVNKFNGERYCDPTAYEALLNIERKAKKTPFKPLVFICSPLAGNTELNTERARRYSRFAVLQGAIPVAPHLLFPQFMDDSDQKQRDLAIFMGMVLMSKCQEVWCFGGKVSSGMAIELEKAKQRGMIIRYFNEQCAEVTGDG